MKFYFCSLMFFAFFAWYLGAGIANHVMHCLKFLCHRDPSRKDPESLIVNESLLCCHGGLLYNPATSDEQGSR